MESLLEMDQSLFYLINHTLSNKVFDTILPFIRNKYVWIPLYVFFTTFAFYNLQIKKAIVVILLCILAFAVSDSVSSQFIKKTVQRPRPCHVESGIQPNLLVTCGSGYSFTSSHATNHMTVAVFLGLTLFQQRRRILGILMLWAITISYAQVYVGVHYPLDIITGMLLGASIGFIFSRFYQLIGHVVDP